MPPPSFSGPLAKYGGTRLGNPDILARVEPLTRDWFLPAGYRLPLDAMGHPRLDTRVHHIPPYVSGDFNASRNAAIRLAEHARDRIEPPGSTMEALYDNTVMPNSHWAAGLRTDREAFIEWLRLRAAERLMHQQNMLYYEMRSPGRGRADRIMETRYAYPNEALKRYMETAGYDLGDISQYSTWPSRNVSLQAPQKLDSNAALDRALRMGSNVRGRLAANPIPPEMGVPEMRTSLAKFAPWLRPANYPGALTHPSYIKGNARALRAANYGLGASDVPVRMPYGMNGSLDLRTAQPGRTEPLPYAPHPMVYQVALPGGPENYFLDYRLSRGPETMFLRMADQPRSVLEPILAAAGARGYKGTVQPEWGMNHYLNEMRDKLRLDREAMLAELRRQGLRGSLLLTPDPHSGAMVPWDVTDYDPAALTVLRQRAKGGSV